MHPSKPRLKAILVEDEPVLVMLLEDMLVEAGIDVAGTAGDLASALALVQSQDFDVAILDAHIIGGDIWPVFEILKNRHLPVVFSTGSSPAAIREKFGNVPVLTKPYLAEQLTAVIQQFNSAAKA